MQWLENNNPYESPIKISYINLAKWREIIPPAIVSIITNNILDMLAEDWNIEWTNPNLQSWWICKTVYLLKRQKC